MMHRLTRSAATAGLCAALVGAAWGQQTRDLSASDRARITRDAQAAKDDPATRKDLVDQAMRQAAPGKINIPDQKTPAAIIDPAKIARQYSQMKSPERREAETNELMVFVSTSMPTGSLERVARDSRKVSGMIVMRGASKGVGPGKWVASIQDMKPLTDNGGQVQLHPDLFERYAITKVPALVIAPDAEAGCTEDACREFAVVYGDVSLEFGLQRLADRKDTIGAIARSYLVRLKK